jgi:hypothetical protein
MTFMIRGLELESKLESKLNVRLDLQLRPKLDTSIIEEFSFFRPPELPITPGPARSLSTIR